MASVSSCARVSRTGFGASSFCTHVRVLAVGAELVAAGDLVQLRCRGSRALARRQRRRRAPRASSRLAEELAELLQRQRLVGREQQALDDRLHRAATPASRRPADRAARPRDDPRSPPPAPARRDGAASKSAGGAARSRSCASRLRRRRSSASASRLVVRGLARRRRRVRSSCSGSSLIPCIPRVGRVSASACTFKSAPACVM